MDYNERWRREKEKRRRETREELLYAEQVRTIQEHAEALRSENPRSCCFDTCKAAERLDRIIELSRGLKKLIGCGEEKTSEA